MKKRYLVLLVLIAVLPFVIAGGAFVLLPFVLPEPTVKVVLVYEVDTESLPPDVPLDMQAVVAAVDRRVNSGGRRGGRVRQLDDGQIEVGLFSSDPDDVARVERLVSSTGTMEFRILANDRDHPEIIGQAEAQEDARVVGEKGELLARWVPVTFGREDSFTGYPEIATRLDSQQRRQRLEVLVVQDRLGVSGAYLEKVRDSVDQTGRPCVNFTFDKRGGQLMAGLTSLNLPDEMSEFTRKLGIILDGRLHSAPAIRSTIGEHGQITGDFTMEEVHDLVDVLNAGALPAGLKRVGGVRQPTDDP